MPYKRVTRFTLQSSLNKYLAAKPAHMVEVVVLSPQLFYVIETVD